MSVSPPCHFLCPRDSSIPFTIQSATEAEERDSTKKEELLQNQGSYLMISRNCVDSALPEQAFLAEPVQLSLFNCCWCVSPLKHHVYSETLCYSGQEM